MSTNSNSASGNSWTLLTPETGVENVGPVAEGNKIEGDPDGSKVSTEVHTDLVKNSTEASAPENCDLVHGQNSEDAKDVHSPEPHQVNPSETGEARAQLNASNVREDDTTVEDLSSWTPDQEERNSESPDAPGTDVDSFSDSYTHISSSSGASAHPASVCQGGEGFKSEESHLKKTRTEDFKPEAPENEEKEGHGLRKRKITQMGSVDQGKTEADEDEEVDEEEFQVPQRDEEKVFSLNKCIIAALILLGLGTIFFSGVLMDPDDEGDIDVREIKDQENKEWLNPGAITDMHVGHEPPDIFSKQAKDLDEQILILQAQLQMKQGELKSVQHLAEEGEKERAKREELEKDYQRIKEELDKLPALQKELEQENQRIKEESERAKRELEVMPSLHKELEQLREQVSQLTQSTERAEYSHPVASSGMPSSGNIRNVPPIEAQDIKHWDKKSTERESNRDEKELKKKKTVNKDGKEKRERVTEEEHVKEQEDWKKGKSKQEEAKSGKDKQWRDGKEWKKDKKFGDVGKGYEEKKAFKDEDEKKERRDEKKWKKDKHEGQDEYRRENKDRKDTEKKRVKEVNENEWKKRVEKKEWKEEKERKNDKQSDQKDKKKEWKEKNEWKREKEGTNDIQGERKGKKKEWKEKDELKWETEGTNDKRGERKGKKKEWKEKDEWKRGKEGENDKQSERKEIKKEWKDKDEWKVEKEWKKGKSEDKINDKTEKKWKGGEKEYHKMFAEKELERKLWKGKDKEWSTDGDWKKDQLKDDKQSKTHHSKHEEKEHHNEKQRRHQDEKEQSNDKKYRRGSSDQTSSHHHHLNPENYWSRQKQKIQHNHRHRQTCSGVAECASVEGLSPVTLQDFEILLQSYLKKIQFPQYPTSEEEEFSKLVREFFTDGVFVHNQMPFSEFVEDVADILEDMADGEESDVEESEEEDDDDDDDSEMEAFEREAMEMFAIPVDAGKKESRKVRG